MDDITLAPLLNAAALANHGIEQLIHHQPQPPPFAAAAAAGSDDEEPPAKKKAKKKPQNNNTITNNYLNHPDSDTHKLQTNQLLLDTASRIEDAISELQEYANLLAADGLKLQHRKNNSRSASAHNIRSSIVPLLQITANTLRDAGKCFAPYRGTERLQERNDIERRRKLMENLTTVDGAAETNTSDERKKKSPALIMIDDFIKRSNWSPPVEKSAASKSPTKRKRKSTASSATASAVPATFSMTLLQPRNGSTYTKSEAIAIARQHKHGKGRRQIIQAMIQKEFIPVNQRSLDRLIKKVEDGEIMLDDEWHVGVGRPSITYPAHMKPKPIDCNLTFDDLDTGDNRIVVEIENKKKRQKVDDEEVVMDGEVDDDNSVEGDAKQQYRYVTSEKTPPLVPKKKKWDVNPKVVAFEVPPPRDGSKLYRKTEFVEVIKTFVPSNQHHIAMRAMMHRGYVGSTPKRSLKALWEKAEKGEPIYDTEWTSGRRGRPPIVSPDEINDIVERIKQEDLRIHDVNDVNQLLVQVLLKRGVVDETKLTMSDKTVADYFTVLKSKLSPMYWKKLDDDDDDGE